MNARAKSEKGQAERGAGFAGPLRVHPGNPRYFTDDSGKAIYLTGSHTWATLQERQLEETPEFDYAAWLDFMEKHGHNFLRMWTWEHAAWMQFTDRKILYGPNPYARTGPGKALDGGPTFDLTKFNDAFFERLRSRVVAAGARGIYVSVMFFQGFSVSKLSPRWPIGGNAFRGHPMHRDNNINGIDGDPNGSGTGRQIHTLDVPAITRLQETYVRTVIDTLNDLDHVLWEIGNEIHESSVRWQYHMIDFVRECERAKPKQHPVGMTGAPIRTPALLASRADWISPAGDARYRNDGSAACVDKIVVVDTDHLNPTSEDATWPWRCLTRGNHFILMDSYMDARVGSPRAPATTADNVRRQMGYALKLARRMDLAATAPRNDLASTQYCLANPGREYLVYLPEGGEADVDLSAVSGTIAATWFNPSTGARLNGDRVGGGARRRFTAPFPGHAVLVLVKG